MAATIATPNRPSRPAPGVRLLRGAGCVTDNPSLMSPPPRPVREPLRKRFRSTPCRFVEVRGQARPSLQRDSGPRSVPCRPPFCHSNFSFCPRCFVRAAVGEGAMSPWPAPAMISSVSWTKLRLEKATTFLRLAKASRPHALSPGAMAPRPSASLRRSKCRLRPRSTVR